MISSPATPLGVPVNWRLRASAILRASSPVASSEAAWPVALRVLRAEGGRLHVHANIGTAAEEEAA